MRLKLGILATALLVASCGTDQALETRYYPNATEDTAGQDADAQGKGLEAYYCDTVENCAPVDFGLTITHNGTIDGDSGSVELNGKTLVAQEGINSLWGFKVSSMMTLPSDREFRFVVSGDVGVGIDLEEKVFNNFVFNVDSSEQAGNIGIKVQDISYCLLNNDGDRDYCENYATDDELRTQMLMVPYFVGKKENVMKAMACTAGDIASLIPGDTALIASVAKILLGCR